MSLGWVREGERIQDAAQHFIYLVYTSDVENKKETERRD